MGTAAIKADIPDVTLRWEQYQSTGNKYAPVPANRPGITCTGHLFFHHREIIIGAIKVKTVP